MILTVDIGNSNIVFGLWHMEIMTDSWRITTDKTISSNAYSEILRDLFKESSVISSDTTCCISSVVPALTNVLREALEQLLHKNVLVMSPELFKYLPLQIINTAQIGMDLVADALSAYTLFNGAPCIVADFGTALTFTVVDTAGRMRGVAIAPGLGTSVRALSRDTAQLPEVELRAPEKPWGEHTVEAIQAGVVWGFTGMVEYMIKKISAELGVDVKTVATGGLCGVIAPLTTVFDRIEPNLTLNGIRLVAEAVHKNK